jgi:signal transduction histidine kinase/AraC-like DNA-binding protein
MRYVLLTVLTLLCSCSGKSRLATVNNGTLNLRGIGQDGSVVRLNGQWLFGWKQLHTKAEQFRPDQLIKVPGSWAAYAKPGWLSSNTGYCSYALRILADQKTLRLRIFLPVINSAYRLYINGKLVVESGRISRGPQMVPAAENRITDFEVSGGEASLVLQVSNYHFFSGGIWAPIVIGAPRQVERYQFKMDFSSAFLIGALLLIGVYHLCLFFLWKKNASTLYFAMICFFTSLREGFAGPAFFFSLFPAVPYSIALKILYICFPVSILFFTLFFSSLLDHFRRRVKNGLTALCLAYFLMVLCQPNVVYAAFLPLLSVVFAFAVIYFLTVSLRSYSSDPTSSVLIISGILILVFCFVNDNLFEQGIIQSYFLLPVGFLIFTVCQSVLLALRFSRIFKQSEDLAIELSKSEERKAVEEFKNRFFANITHEFRTPLMLILSPVEELIRTDSLEAEVVKPLRTVHRNASKLLRLINQLLDISKADSGNMQVSYSGAAAERFFGLMIANFSPLATERGLILAYSYHGGAQETVTDWEKIEKIGYNLLMNAINFTPAGGKVSLRIEDGKNGLVICVSDTGRGIAKAQQQAIFERFYQVVDPALPGSGTGIGLSLVKELTRLLHGEIHLSSDPQNGSVFTVTIPLATAPQALYGEYTPEKSLVPLGEFSIEARPGLIDAGLETILLVEDNQELADFMVGILGKMYNVLWEPNGALGLETCRSALPSLVISDIMMPEMDGIALCQHIKQDQQTDHIGVILLTAKTAVNSRLEGLASKANDYLTKPFHAQELLLRIENFYSFRERMRVHYQRELQERSEKGLVDNPFLIKLYAYLDSRLDDSALSMEEIAGALAVSQRTLSRKLLALLGYSPSEAVRRYRLQRASAMLSLGINVSQVAYAVGFESPSYFSQCFREIYGVTPTEFSK